MSSSAWQQWRKSGWNLQFWGDAGWMQKAWWGLKVKYGEGVPPADWGGGYAPSPEKKRFFNLKWRVLVHFERYLLSVSLPEKC